MKIKYHRVHHEGYTLKKVKHGDGNNGSIGYTFICPDGKEHHFVIRGEWESNGFERCVQKMIVEWSLGKYETFEEQEENSESPIESSLYRELKEMFPGEIVQQHKLYQETKIKTRPDIFLPEHNICVYCDGHEFHERTKEQAKHDRSIDRWLQKKGYIVLRYTGSEIWNDAHKCAQDILNYVP